MNVIKRKLFTLTAVLTALTSLCSCAAMQPISTPDTGNNSNNSSNSDDSSIVSQPIDDVAYDGSEVTVTFYHCMGAQLRGALDNSITEFNRLYPNIRISAEPKGSYPNLYSFISTKIDEGEAPSLAYCMPDHVLSYIEKDAILPLDNWIESTKTVQGSHEAMGFTEAQLNDFRGYYLEGSIYTQDGTMYSLPFLRATDLLYYNKTYFEEHRLSVPTTWDEMEATCAAILEIEGKKEGGLQENPCIPLGIYSDSNWFITRAMQLGSDFSTKKQNGVYPFHNPTNRAFMEEFYNWCINRYATTHEVFDDYPDSLFKETDSSMEKSFMCIASSAAASTLCPAPTDGNYPFEVGVAAIPQEANSSYPAAVLSQGPSLCLFKQENSQEMAAAWLFAKFITTHVPTQATLSMLSGYTSVLQSVVENAVYQEFLRKADGNRYLTATAITKSYETIPYQMIPAPGSVDTAAITKLVGRACSAKLLEGETVAEWIKTVFDDIANELDLKKS